MAWKTAPGGWILSPCNPISETLGSNGHEPQAPLFYWESLPAGHRRGGELTGRCWCGTDSSGGR